MICKNKNCKKGIFEKRANSKDIVFYNSYYCSKECISEYYSQHSENVIKKSRLEVKKDFLKEKRAIINYKVKLQNKVQEIARLIDHHLPCLARGKFGQMHGGHIYSKGSSPNCKFNLHNIHRQSAQSNHWQNDDYLLREGLKKEYGDEYFEFILSLRNTAVVKYSNKEYEDFYKMACKIATSLRNNINDEPYSLIERIELRNDINKTLGIYDNRFLVFLYSTKPNL
jgi:hypothetical protein